MTDAPPSPDDDQQWFELLAGRAAPDAHQGTAQEAAWLRAALLAYRAQAPAGEPAPPEQRAERLVERARAAGIVPRPTQPPPDRRRVPWWPLPLRAWPWAGALLATLVGAMVALPWLLPEPHEPEAPVLRGDAVQTRQASDPAADREAVRAALRAVGIEAAPYQRLDRLGLDIELPQPLSADQRQALIGLGLVPPAGPALRIEFVAAGAAP